MTKKKPTQVTDDLIKVPKECLKLNKYVFLIIGIFFMNKIPLFITLSHKIDFIATIHLPTQTARDIFKSFWCIYVFYLKRGFKTKKVHTDG